jgi:hypothetical protein
MEALAFLSIPALLAAVYAVKLVRDIKIPEPAKCECKSYTKEEVNNLVESVRADVEHLRMRVYELMH